MGVLLASERHTAKGRIFLAIVYAVLALGGLTMVLPFLIMLASSLSGPYDYNRHSPVVRALWDRNDRFMRSLATYFPRFPREIYPDAPESWSSWATVARDADGIAAFAAQHLEPAWTNLAVRADWKRHAESFRDRTLAWDIDYTTCAYDARDVAPFVKSQATLDDLNRTWPVRYRSFFDISFTAESKIPLGHASWKPPKDDPKYAMWCAFKDSYRQRMVADGDYICRTLPFPLITKSQTTNHEPQATDIRAALAIQFIEHGDRDFWRSAFGARMPKSRRVRAWDTKNGDECGPRIRKRRRVDCPRIHTTAFCAGVTWTIHPRHICTDRPPKNSKAQKAGPRAHLERTLGRDLGGTPLSGYHIRFGLVGDTRAWPSSEPIGAGRCRRRPCLQASLIRSVKIARTPRNWLNVRSTIPKVEQPFN